jgi:hypothetical protein
MRHLSKEVHKWREREKTQHNWGEASQNHSEAPHHGH